MENTFQFNVTAFQGMRATVAAKAPLPSSSLSLTLSLSGIHE